MSEIKGIDLSTWQKEVDWQEVKSDGIHFAILRAGFGNGTRDEMFESHIKGALGAGLGVGVYWFLYPASVEDARREARECLKIIEPYKGKINYPVYADYEYDSDRYAQAGWSWYTGSAGWFFRVVTGDLLGLAVEDGKLTARPNVPEGWKFGASLSGAGEVQNK